MSKISAYATHQVQGLLHIGNARTALFNYLYAIMVELLSFSIEDTDRKRHVWDGERSQRKPSLVGHGLG